MNLLGFGMIGYSIIEALKSGYLLLQYFIK